MTWQVSRIASLYLLGFGLVWAPTLLVDLAYLVAPASPPPYALAMLEAACMPLQGAINALVYSLALPAIRDVYRMLLLGW